MFQWKRCIAQTTCLFICAQPSTASAQAPQPTVSPDPPADVAIPVGFPGDPVAFFDDFSWRTFVALNWPALSDRRGEPDRAKALGDDSDNVVWGTWKADHEIFQPGGMKPSEWDSFEAQSPDRFTPFYEAGKVKVLGGFGSLGSLLQIDHFNQAGLVGDEQGSLVSRNRQYVRYEIRINKMEFDFIRDGEFYLGSKIDELVSTKGQLVFPRGSAEIKASWRLFTEDELADSELIDRYYRTEAVLVNPDGSRTNAVIGLIGLHIVRRTETRPEWIWSSFEHVDNDTGANSTLVVSTDPDPNNWNVLRPAVNKPNPPLPDPDPVAVKRLRASRTETTNANQAYHAHPAIRDTVWKNYALVMTQWPRTPAEDEAEFIANFRINYPAGAGNPSPDEGSNFPIANLTMETSSSFQESQSCMRCHFNAGRIRKTEFVWTVALQAFRSDPEETERIMKDLREHVKPLMEEVKSD